MREALFESGFFGYSVHCLCEFAQIRTGDLYDVNVAL